MFNRDLKYHRSPRPTTVSVRSRVNVNAAHLKSPRRCILNKWIARYDIFISQKRLSTEKLRGAMVHMKWQKKKKNTMVLSAFQNKMKINLRRYIFISSSQRETESQGCLKNKWMPNNVFDVLYLNLYGYLHYSYLPGLGTNPIDMEMGCSVSWQSWGERERERIPRFAPTQNVLKTDFHNPVASWYRL